MFVKIILTHTTLSQILKSSLDWKIFCLTLLLPPPRKQPLNPQLPVSPAVSWLFYANCSPWILLCACIRLLKRTQVWIRGPTSIKGNSCKISFILTVSDTELLCHNSRVSWWFCIKHVSEKVPEGRAHEGTGRVIQMQICKARNFTSPRRVSGWGHASCLTSEFLSIRIN